MFHYSLKMSAFIMVSEKNHKYKPKFSAIIVTLNAFMCVFKAYYKLKETP